MATTQRQKLQKRRNQEKRRQTITWALISVAVLVVIAIMIFQSPAQEGNNVQNSSSTTQGIGEMIPVASAAHVEDGEPVESPSDPPTSGTHYGVSMPAGFYYTNSPEYLAPHDGYLIHSLEHGYIIFWYNCDLLDEESCSILQGDIQDVMDELDGFKLIAFPRPTIDVPLVMTSWGYLQEFETFDAQLALSFIETNRPLAPEPFGQ